MVDRSAGDREVAAFGRPTNPLEVNVTDPPAPISSSAFGLLAAEVRAQRRVALHALQVLEYALTAPAPRRHRTWLHRVTIAVDALHLALRTQSQVTEEPIRLLDEIALSNPRYLTRIERLRQELLDLTIAVASLREHIEPDPVMEINPDDIRERLAILTRQFRQHQAREADLVFEATGLELDEAT
jgi:hypothetical protein